MLVLVEADETTMTSVLKFVIICFPLPYRVGEATNPGNLDEKINTEAATYAWLQRNCPEVPIPQLYGFGLSTNKRASAKSLWTFLLHANILMFSGRISNSFLASLAGSSGLDASC